MNKKSILLLVLILILSVFCSCDSVDLELSPDGDIRPPDKEYTEEELEFIYLYRNSPPYPADFLIGDVKCERILTSANSVDSAMLSVKNTYENNLVYPNGDVNRNTVTACDITDQGIYYYCMHVQYLNECLYANGNYSSFTYEADVICFNKDFYDYDADSNRKVFLTRDGEIIRHALNSEYSTRCIGAVTTSSVTEDASAIIYSITYFFTVYGDWGMQDSVTLYNDVWSVSKADGSTSVTRNVVMSMFLDGACTHVGIIN